MSEEDALLSAIAAQPDEDTPRLAYADWLDEHGRHARAEFIRLQIERAPALAAYPDTDRARHYALFAREKALLTEHRREVLGPLAALPDDCVTAFHRGFVSAVRLSVHEFLQHAKLIAAVRPLSRVGVIEVAERAADFLLCPHTGCVTEIQVGTVQSFTFRPEDLDDLDLIDGIERLTRLERLDLAVCAVNDLHIDLAFNYSLPALTELGLSYNFITDSGVENLLRTDLPKQLRQLVLDRNAITDTGARRLAEAWPTGAADRLEHLTIDRNHLTDEGRRVLRERFGSRAYC